MTSVDEVVALYDPDDECGRVTGSAPRSRVRAENLPHAATAVFVRRGDGQVLVHRRSDTKDLWPGLHDCASGGVVLAGEHPEQAARRELREELGFEPGRLVPLLTTWYRDADTHYLAHVYETLWDGELSFADGEVADAWWEPQQDVGQRLLDPTWPFVPDTRRFVALLFGSVPGSQVMPGARAVAPGDRWAPGSPVVYRWGRGGRALSARMTVVVAHDHTGLLLWVPPGSPTVDAVAADGRGLRKVPLAERGAIPRVRRRGAWRGPGALMWVPPEGQAWSVWWFFAADGAFAGWYGNLEAPHALRRTAHGTRLVDTADRALDVVVAPDGSSRWKDEDEFAAYTGLPGRWSERDVAMIRADGEHLMARAAAGSPPFDGRWTAFRPDPAWPLPRFPSDWDVPHQVGP